MHLPRFYDPLENYLKPGKVLGRLCSFEFKWKPQKVKVPQEFFDAYGEAEFSTIRPQNYLDFIL